MSVRVEVICINAAGAEQRHQVLSIERAELAMETLGMSLDEGKALLAAVQDIVVAHQVQGDLERPSCMPILPRPTYQQGFRQHTGEHGVRPGPGTEPALEPLRLSD